MAVKIDFIGTEAFYTNWSGNSSVKADQICDFCEDIWQRYIQDGVNYRANFDRWSQANVMIPNSTFQSSTLCTRLGSQQSWLDSNWAGFPASDAVVVMDYCTGGNVYGSSYNVTAGTPPWSVATIDTHLDDNNLLIGEFDVVRSGGIAQHELGHLFAADHPDDVSTNDASEASIMYSPSDGIGCTNEAAANIVADWHSSCAIDVIHNCIDNI
jgi:hypothetical protein